MSKRNDRDFLSDMREAINRITTYVTGKSFLSFVADTKTQDAVIRNLEILGEAAKNLSESVRSQYSGIPWKSMASVRDRLIHHYFGVNLDIVWQIATIELPRVASQLPDLVQESDEGDTTLD